MKKLSLILTALLCFMLVSCSAGSDNKNSSSSDIRNSFLESANEVTVTDTGIIFTDAVSDTPIEIAKNPKRVVCMYPSYGTLWYEAGGELIGCIGGNSASEVYTAYIGRDIASDHQMTVLGTTAAGKNWDVETILALKPDLIICSTAMNGYGTLDAPASAAGIPLVAVDYDNFSDYLKWFKVFCNLTGHAELWESVALKALDEAVSVIEAVKDSDSPSVFSMFAGTTGLKANTSNTVPGEMLMHLNAVNIADTGNDSEAERIDINLETVFAAQPDIILVQCHAGIDSAMETVEETLGDNKVWNSLDAVKNGRIFYMDKMLFHNKPNSRFAEAYRILAEMLYPDSDF